MDEWKGGVDEVVSNGMGLEKLEIMAQLFLFRFDRVRINSRLLLLLLYM